jgi:hypothetical protein
MNQVYESAENTLGSEQWIASFADGLYEEARDAVLESIEQVERLDPGNRRLVWQGGTPLSFDESVEKIFSAYPTLPMVLIRSHLFSWLEQGELPGDLSDEEMEELDSLMEPWIDDLEAVRYQATDT